MVNFKGFIFSGDAPIYVQIVDYVKKEIIAGRISDGDIMPSRRVLSTLLGVNPNTIQKSYKILEEEGIILSQSGAKSQVTLDKNLVLEIRDSMVKDALIDMVAHLKHMKVTKERTFEILEEYWEDEDEE